ncbi:MAG TPA: zinc ribbon domain-containing protein [Thermoplasmata archaeon]|nr:zinc ribbon domain-containing protein [Thermoplasmata archaeon]
MARCPSCGRDPPPAAAFCPACGTPLESASRPSPAPPPESFERAAYEAKEGAKKLAAATARVSARLLHKASTAADHPSESLKSGLKRVGRELESMAKDLDRLLNDLK